MPETKSVHRYVDEVRLLVGVAELYYDFGKTQQEIAEVYNVSRTMVSRLLTQAREVGIVQIKIVDPVSKAAELRQRLIDRFGLQDAVVLPSALTVPQLLSRKLAQAAAEYIEQRIQPGQVLGIGRGLTVYHTANGFSTGGRLGLQVVPLCGGMGETEAFFQVNEMARVVAEHLGGTPHYLYAPGFMGHDTEVHVAVAMANPVTKATCEFWDRLDWCLMGVGAVTTYHTPGYSEVLRSIYGEVVLQQVVGDINLWLLNGDGEIVRPKAPITILGVSPEQLRKAPGVIGVSGGPKKAVAIRSALKSGLLNVLITDEQAAAAALNEPGE